MLQKGIIIALMVLALDQLNKWYMLEVVQIAEAPIEVFPFFNFVMVWNNGISFGMFQDTKNAQIIFSIIALAISAIMLIWLRKTTCPITAISIGFIIGGALGNTVDRVRFGAVADFFDFHIMGYHWPAFNIADMAVFVGALVLCIDSLFCKRECHK